MNKVPFTGVAKNAFGFALSKLKKTDGTRAPKSLPYKGEYEAFENFGELVAAQEQLTNDEQVKARNAQRKAKAKTATKNLAVLAAGIVEPTMQNDEQIQLKAVFDGIMARGKKTREEARKLAEEACEAKWADSDEDEDGDEDE